MHSKYKVRHGQRTFEFDGVLVASSTSKQVNSYRWVDFRLYITVGGSYILERVGQTLIYHDIGCLVVERNNLKFNPEDRIEPYHIPCYECAPDPEDPQDVILIEKPRYYGLVSDSPDAILEALHKRDSNGARYMTNVTERLIEDACKYDKRLENAYRVEKIL